jgi:hypothetical protein
MGEAISDIREKSRSNAAEPPQVAVPGRRDPVVWLIACGVLLIAAIILGTVMMVGEFRERALANSERELESTVLLLTRHFDQQFEDYQVLMHDLIFRLEISRIESPEAFRERMFGLAAHDRLKAQASVLSYVDHVNVYDAEGEMINSRSTLRTGIISRRSNRIRKLRHSSPRRCAAMTRATGRRCWPIA